MIRRGIVPVRNPTGHRSVNINPITYDVIRTRRMTLIYLIYRKYGSNLLCKILLIILYLLHLRAIFAVPRCKKPTGHAQAQTSRPEIAPIVPKMRNGYNKNLQVKFPLYTLCSIALIGHAEEAVGHAWQ
jgi:hypothetical protein